MKKTGMLLYLLLQIALAWAQTPYTAQIKKADSLTKAKDYKNAALTYSIAFRMNKAPADQDIRYNAACAWALANYPDSAFNNLNTIVGKTYFNYDHLSTDADLKAIHNDKRWLPLLHKIQAAKLTIISPDKLYQDFDLLVSALKEAHGGLYWYNTQLQFDSICRTQKNKIKPGMTDLDFYNVVAPLNAFIKDGHTPLSLGPQTQAYLRFGVKYFPVYLKFFNKKAYIINNVGEANIKGLTLTKVNGHTIDELMQKFMAYEPADGYNTTSKYRWIEQNAKFSTYYALCYPPENFYEIEVIEPITGQKQSFKHIAALSYDKFRQLYKAVSVAIPNVGYTLPAEINIDTVSKTCKLTVNSFSSSKYKNAGMDFHKFIDESFKKINELKVAHLVIDIRKNGGGREGYEDYLLAYLIDKDYLKYKYVQASAFTYSFYKYTDYKTDYNDLDKELKDENYLEKDGRILRKPGIEEHEKPKPGGFKGDIYILINGLTFSGGSEFASLARNHTNATFIGEETGGGYYGNTSGTRLYLGLPNSKLQIGIPILKFVVDTPKDDVLFGHGTMPDYEVQPNISQFLSGYDAELEMAKKLILKK
jgi:hypothetical protein